MVRLMIEGLRSGHFGNFQIFHIDARFSDTMDQIGGTGFKKLWRAVKFSAQAIRLRFDEKIDTFYYIPAPPKKSAMMRDWIVLGICRIFYPKVVLHWHAVGLGMLTSKMQEEKSLRSRLASWLNRRIFGQHFRSLVLTEWGKADVAPFKPQSVSIVSNGISDPCPDFDLELLPARIERRAVFQKILAGDTASATFQVCFLGHCTSEKGLWDAMTAIALATAKLKSTHPALTISLRVAGEFPSDSDRKQFGKLKEDLKRQYHLSDRWIEHVGFVGGEAKETFLRQADCLCFPTRYSAESFGLVAAEALAFGIPPVTSDWRMLPELMTKVGLPVTRTGDPESLAAGIIAAIGRDSPADLRASFLEHFTAEAHLTQLASALKSAS